MNLAERHKRQNVLIASRPHAFRDTFLVFQVQSNTSLCVCLICSISMSKVALASRIHQIDSNLHLVLHSNAQLYRTEELRNRQSPCLQFVPCTSIRKTSNAARLSHSLTANPQVTYPLSFTAPAQHLAAPCSRAHPLQRGHAWAAPQCGRAVP